MNVCYDDEELENFLKMAGPKFQRIPGSCFLTSLKIQKKLNLMLLPRNGEVVEYAISEHVEFRWCSLQ